jgi:geranylgeranyl pyrophosphate synthase
MAILAGDALHTLAMQLIATHPNALSTSKRLQMIATLSQACGPYGMAGGQALDITLMNADNNLSEDLLTDIYRLKTGALFTACVELGWLASEDNDETHRTTLKEFADCLGFAFQIQDDIFDIESHTTLSGKEQGLDMKNNKITYPTLFGIQNAKLRVESLHEEALAAINYLGHRAQLLRELAHMLIHRRR